MNDFRDAYLMLEDMVIKAVKSLEMHSEGNEKEIEMLKTARKLSRETFISSRYMKKADV